MSASLIDTIIFASILGFAIWGIFKGFISQAVSIVALFLGIWCAFKFSNLFAIKVIEWFSLTASPETVKIIMFIAIFFGVLIISNLIGKALEKIIHLSMLGWLNRLLGFVFATLKIIIVLCIIVSAIGYFNPTLGLIPDDVLNQSKGYIFLKECSYTLFPYLRSIFEK